MVSNHLCLFDLFSFYLGGQDQASLSSSGVCVEAAGATSRVTTGQRTMGEGKY